MSEVNILITPDVESILLEVQENTKGYDVYLGGGYLRDQFCELSYKDIDIFLVPNGEEKQLVPYTPKGYGINYTKSCEDSNDMKRRGVGALIGFYKRTALYDLVAINHEVQYIIYDKPMTQEDLCEDMDMTINQVMWKPINLIGGVSTCMCTEEFLEDHEYGELRFTHHYDEIRMYYRLERMKEKFPSYDVYEEVELSHEQQVELHEKGDKEYEPSA